MSEMALVIIGVAIGLAVAFMLWWINASAESSYPYARSCPCGLCEANRADETSRSDDQFLRKLVVLDRDTEVEDYQW